MGRRKCSLLLLLLFCSVTLTGQTPVQITTASPLPAGEVGVAYELQIFFSGGTPQPGQFNPSYTYTSNFSVPGLVLPNGSSDFSARIGGTPTAAGTYSFTVNVSDGQGGSASKAFQLTIHPRLEINTQTLPDATEGVDYSFQISYGGGLTPYQLFTCNSGIPGFTCSQQGLVAGKTSSITGVTQTYQGGIQLSIRSGRGFMASRNFNLTVKSGVRITIAALGTGPATGGNPPYTYTFGVLPTGLSGNANGTISGTPAAASAGTHTITVTARDADGRTTTGTYTLQITQSTTPATEPPKGFVGEPYSWAFPLTGDVTIVSKPDWLQWNPAQRVFTGTPVRAGTETIVLTRRISAFSTVTETYRIVVEARVTPAQDPSVTCDVKPVANPPLIRAEGGTELIGDIVIQCRGGIPTPAGQPLPKVNISLNFTPNVAITSPAVPFQGRNDLVGAVLLIDEPSPQKQTLCGSLHYPATSTGLCEHFGAPSGNGIGTYDPDLGRGRGNTYLGRGNPNSITWLGLPFDPPGTIPIRTMRITNIRVNASQLNVPRGGREAVFLDFKVVPFVSQGSPILVTNGEQTVAVALYSTAFSVTQSGTLPQCAGDSALSTTAILSFSEVRAMAFKRRNLAVTPFDPDAPPPAQHAFLGAQYNTESGYVSNVSQDRFPVRIGAADSGTRLKASFHNLPAGTTLLVSVNALQGSTASARLLGPTASSTVDGVTVGVIPVSNGSGTAVWETVENQASSLAVMNFRVYATYQPNPALGTSSVRGSFDDTFLFAGVDSQGRPTTRPIPSFAHLEYTGDDARGAPAAFTVTDCANSGQLIPQPAVTSGALPVNYRLQGNRPNSFSLYLLSGGAPITGVEAGAPNVSWLTLEKNTSTTPVTFKINVNPEGLAAGSYSGSFRVSGTGIPAANFTVPLNVLPPAPHFTRWGVANAASYVSNLVSPGGALTLFGERFGPPNLVTATLTPEGRLSTNLGDTRVLFNGDAANPEATLSTNLGDTRVLFDGVAAPMIYATAGQVSVLAPFGLAGKTFTNIEIEYKGVRSPPVAVPVAPAVPALLTADASGFGRAAALNEDNSFNSVTGALPGQYVVFFGVGGPNTEPGGRDGEINTTSLGRFPGPIKVLLDGTEVPAAAIAYIGPAPSLVHGVWQANVRMPADAARNRAKQIQFIFGDAATQPGVEVLVR